MKSRPHSHFHRLLLLAASAAGIAGSQQPPYLLPSASTAWQKLRGTGNFVPRSGGEKPRGICTGKDCLGAWPCLADVCGAEAGDSPPGAGGARRERSPAGRARRRCRSAGTERPGREAEAALLPRLPRRLLPGLGGKITLHCVCPLHGYPGCQRRAAALTRAAARGCGSAPGARTELELNVGIRRFTLSITFFANFSWGAGGGVRRRGGGGN